MQVVDLSAIRLARSFVNFAHMGLLPAASRAHDVMNVLAMNIPDFMVHKTREICMHVKTGALPTQEACEAARAELDALAERDQVATPKPSM